LGTTGEVIAVDLRSIEPIPGVEIVRGTVGDPRLLDRLGPEKYDVVLSDMSPRISGAYATDHARSVALARLAASLSSEVLRKHGVLVAKVFDGDLLDELENELAPMFRTVVRTKPPASREHSSELYLLGLDFQRRRAPRVGS
jgi:23S rRNA (uridine2552-2'-O)-methyltransferase